MIHVAAINQTQTSLFNDEKSASLSLCSGDFDKSAGSDRRCKIAFVGFSVWRPEENGDGNLSDQQVFVIRDGEVRPLPAHADLYYNHSRDDFSWGYPGSGPWELTTYPSRKISAMS